LVRRRTLEDAGVEFIPAKGGKGVGVLGSGFAASSAILIDSFKQRMRENGFSEGHDYVLDVRWAEGDSQHNFGALFAAL
jgi:hypothetical protein